MLTVSHEAEDLARQLAARSGKTPEDVITDAVRDRARLLGLADESPTDKDAVIAAALAIVREYQTLPILDHRTADEIVGYDERGLSA
jgi:antitoxin VapB